MKEIKEPEDLEEEELEEEDEAAVVAPGEEIESSFDEIAAKQVEVPEEEEEESLLTLAREERFESLSIRAAPKQANEFVCRSCHLVKHNSQLADAKRQLCRDCV